MAIARWDPFSEMISLRKVMDRLFEEALVRPPSLASGDSFGAPPMDIYETPDELVVTASLPGIKPEDLDVTIANDRLRIQGETRRKEDVKDEQYHRQERRFGRFYREIALPVSVKSDAVRADFTDGILTLHMPKAEEAKPRRIQIEAGRTPQLSESTRAA
ncbi:MAG TPA: Hsp20/alpha crystallin family protein [Chloroflexota bacterium]|nr:Hsp20/alpha crystallin family protein [Chloroflexota bacterium]